LENILRKVVVVGGAILGGVGGWYYAGVNTGSDIVLGVIIGALVAN
jgi:hypothetical protein